MGNASFILTTWYVNSYFLFNIVCFSSLFYINYVICKYEWNGLWFKCCYRFYINYVICKSSFCFAYATHNEAFYINYVICKWCNGRICINRKQKFYINYVICKFRRYYTINITRSCFILTTWYVNKNCSPMIFQQSTRFILTTWYVN